MSAPPGELEASLSLGPERFVEALLPAMDRLNRAARTYDCPVPQSWIYTLKDRTITVATSMGAATHQLVSVRMKCTVCGGTGIYGRHRDWEEECRACAGEGGRDLNFVETAIGATQWHTPANKGEGLELWRQLVAVGQRPRRERSWRPRQPGESIAPELAAQLLVHVEQLLVPTWLIPPPAHQRYHLQLGRMTLCRSCLHREGREGVEDMRCRNLGRALWTSWLCVGCDASASTAVVEHPHPLLANEHVARWIETHPVPPPSCPPVPSSTEDEIPF